MTRAISISIILILFTSVGWQVLVEAAPNPTWEDLHWAERATRALRGGEGLAPNENPAQMLKNGKASLVAHLLDDARFADTILEFNMYVLGFKQDRIRKENGNYQDSIYEFPNAIRSAQAL